MIRGIVSDWALTAPRTLIILLTLTIGMSCVAAARAWLGRPAEADHQDPLGAATQAQATKAVSFKITPLGLEPAELTIPAGRYLVAIDNAGNLTDIDLNIDKEDGPRLASPRIPRHRRKWRGFVDFSPGRFVFSVPNDEKLRCRVTITDR